MDIKQVEKLAKILAENGLTRLEISQEQTHILLEKQPAPGAAGAVTAVMPAPVASGQAAAAPVADTAAPAAAPVDGFIQKSPLVGTVYLAPEVGADPFVKVGDTVHKGDVLCIVESMKILNEIAAEQEGVIAEILVENQQMVEYGQPLFIIR